MSAQTNKTKSRALDGLTRKGGTALIFAIAAPLIGGLLLVWQAWTLADVLGRAIELGEPAAALAPSILLIFGLLLVRSLLGALGEQAGLSGAETIKLHLRRGLMAQLLARSPRAVDTAPSGVAAAAIIDQVDTLEGYFARYLPAAMQAALLPLIFGAIILPLDWVAGVLFLITAPLIPVFMALVGWGAQIATDRQARALSHLSGRFADRLRGLLTLKLFGREAAETAGIVEASEALRLRTLKVLRIAFLSSAVLEFFAALGVAGIALYVGLTFIDYLQLRSSPLSLQLGMFLLLMAPEVYNPLRLFASHYHDRDTARSAMLEIEQQLGNPSAEAPPLNDIAPRQGPALALRLAGVTLRTPDRMASVALDLSFDVPAGQTIALLGPSGSGKSTLLEAIVGLREHSGEILLDDRKLAQWPEGELRARSFLLTQKPRIIHASLAQNIALGRPGATRQEIESAAARALVSDFALGLPDGLDTLVGEDGVGLSGGQAQRIALARLFLRDAGLILLDEPTAHLGADMEQEIATNLLAYARGRTMVIATHSEALAARMDRAYRLTGGDLFATPLPKTKRGVA
ncbi:ATP-binding cassette subfamily C protein CydD [Devosia subaequoris]|uniref:ATP-binding cassette subfamily C protein CydD n=1 Tax=Devosia subaequoris TaxID=395930 RepID=A0A7W6IKA0_9HYPH|nr:ATP-binding cassette subfamily C protein CydD [Devosia subaequoris]MCP1208210.1 thiol reductant ABC exporter subunit CydD [Devosia subaequoris]